MHTQKHLGFQLDSKLSFNEHTNEKISTETKGIWLFHNLQPILPRRSLSIINDVIYDQPCNASFSNKIESVQYNAALAITGAIKGSSCDKFYEELGLSTSNREDG